MRHSRKVHVFPISVSDCLLRYESEKSRVTGISCGDQLAWYSVADGAIRLAKIANALARPVEECREWLRRAVHAYREVFARRGSKVSRRIRYVGGQPLPEEIIVEDGYTVIDSMQAAFAALSLGELELARELIGLAGEAPNAELISPRSVVCTTNELALSEALSALLSSHFDLARGEVRKLLVRRSTKGELQQARIMLAIAGDGDVVEERDQLLAAHAKEASRLANQLDCSYWICLPAVALSFLAVRLARCKATDLATDNPYCPVAIWLDATRHSP